MKGHTGAVFSRPRERDLKRASAGRIVAAMLARVDHLPGLNNAPSDAVRCEDFSIDPVLVERR